MEKQVKSETNNAWTSITTQQMTNCSGDCKCGKKKKTETDNQWISTNKNGDSGCGCK